MATTYEEIYDLFTIRIQDYQLDALYNADVSAWNTHINGFMNTAIQRFENRCKQDLTDRNDTTETFNITLTDKEQYILVSYMVIVWFGRHVRDIRQMSLKLNETDFKHYSESQNLKEKDKSLRMHIQDNDRDVSDYVNDEIIPWDDWANGNYGGNL